MALVVLVLLAVAPATQGAKKRKPALTPEEWDQALLEIGLDPASVTNPLAYTPEMEEATRKATAGVVTTLDKLERIQEYLFDPASAFTYDFVGTLTAAQAFEDRQGNCVAFTNLFISMSRAAGIPVQAALVSPRSGADETEGDLALVKNHIVALYRHSAGSTVYDFYTSRTGAPISVRPIDDLWSAAIYVNNLGVQALRENDLDLALVRFNIALHLAPVYVPVYGNVGVVRRRMGDTVGAFDSYLLGLLIEPHNSTIRNNLFQTLEENAQNAATAFEQAATGSPESDYRRLMLRAGQELLNSEVRDARALYKRAHRKDRTRVAPIVAMARCELLLGNPDAARKRLGDALALDADDASAKRLDAAIERIFVSKRKGRRRDETDVVAPRPGWESERLGRESGDQL